MSPTLDGPTWAAGPADTWLVTGADAAELATNFAAALVAADPTALAGVTYLGATSAPMVITAGTAITERDDIQQIQGVADRTRTSRTITYASTWAGVTLEKIAIAVDAKVTGTGATQRLVPNKGISVYGIIVDEAFDEGTTGHARPEPLRYSSAQVSSTAEVGITYDKGARTGVPITFAGLVGTGDLFNVSVQPTA